MFVMHVTAGAGTDPSHNNRNALLSGIGGDCWRHRATAGMHGRPSEAGDSGMAGAGMMHVMAGDLGRMQGGGTGVKAAA